MSLADDIEMAVRQWSQLPEVHRAKVRELERSHAEAVDLLRYVEVQSVHQHFHADVAAFLADHDKRTGTGDVARPVEAAPVCHGDCGRPFGFDPLSRKYWCTEACAIAGRPVRPYKGTT